MQAVEASSISVCQKEESISLIVAFGRSETCIPCHQVLLHNCRENRNMLSIKILYMTTIYGVLFPTNFVVKYWIMDECLHHLLSKILCKKRGINKVDPITSSNKTCHEHFIYFLFSILHPLISLRAAAYSAHGKETFLQFLWFQFDLTYWKSQFLAHVFCGELN